MFTHLSERLNKVIKSLTGQGRLTENNIKDTLRDIRIALLEADVALPVAIAFINAIQAKAIGKEVLESLTPGQVLIKLVHDELITIMGDANEELNLKTEPPAVILMTGLQGSGKTTTVAKLAKWLKQSQNKTVLVTSVDIYRPAAIDQLATLANTIGVDFFSSNASQHPVDIALQAVQAAKNKVMDVLIIDTAGRLHIDEQMMSEMKRIHAAIQPIETLFVVDSMTGQDAAHTAKAFNDALPLTGVVLTKADGDAKGGAALSIRHLTGKPIKFIGMGEKIDALEAFYPDRMASRILGMGDILTLVEEAERTIDKAKAEKFAKKMKKGKSFDLEDFRDQLKQIHQMGGVMNIMGKLPGMNHLPQQVKDQFNDKKLIEIEAIINSMTPKERRFPERIKNSHKRRIATGSGTSIQAINQLLKQFEHMQRMMKKMAKKGGTMKLMRHLQSKLPFSGLPPF
ncbi:MAG: signal recognition particle protein [Gammaproteobacteria bacterium RIFCSPHIGHO2_12_FULL_37_34]|nr:MAG: signal recognition particle protein [Gammaproteobacteria bacterium RIFCSPHIGHO2_12_FULL_37_34]